MGCNFCGQMRSHFPAAIRKRLEEVERRMNQAKGEKAEQPQQQPQQSETQDHDDKRA